MMTLFAVPSLRDALESDSLKTSVTRIVSTASRLDHEAARERTDMMLHLDVDEGLVWTTSADMTPEARRDRRKQALQFPKDVRITGMSRFDGTGLHGDEAVIRFHGRGYRNPSIVYLARGDDYFTLIFEPFLPGVIVREGRVRHDEIR
jgi:hypothetical protein